MKVAVLGTGSIGKRHLLNLYALKKELGVSQIRCFDQDTGRMEAIKEKHAEIVLTNSIVEAAAGVDAVFVCVPTSLHIPVIEEMNQLGKFHIYLEKPFSHTLNGCEQLIRHQERIGKVLAVGYLLPNHPLLQRVKKLLDQGLLGRILSVRAESGFYLPYWHPWEDYREFYMAWKTGGGGALLDTSHEINYLQWLFGDIQEVSGFVGTISDLEISSDDFVAGIFRFKNGIVGQLQLDLLQFDEARYCKIIGTHAVVVADLTKNRLRTYLESEGKWNEEVLEVNFDEIYHMQLRYFFQACKGRKTPVIDGKEAFKTMQVIEAIRRSTSYSTTVKLPLYD